MTEPDHWIQVRVAKKVHQLLEPFHDLLITVNRQVAHRDLLKIVSEWTGDPSIARSITFQDRP